MGLEVIRFGGRALRHMLGVLLLAWRRVIRTAGISLVVSFVVAEVVGAIVTHHFPPYLLTTVVALALGIVVAYCAGVMVLVDELLRGALDMVRVGLGEVEAEARAAAIIAEREVGDVWGWAQRLIAGRDAARPRLAAPNRATSARAAPVASGPLRATARTLGQFPMPRTTTGAPAPAISTSADSASLRVPPRLGGTLATPTAMAAISRDETRDDIAATDVFRKTAPPLPANAHPVRADRLPRIEWASEGLAAGAALLESALAARERRAHQPHPTKHSPVAGADQAPLDALPPLPQRAPAAAVPSGASATLSVPPAPAAAAPATVPLAPAAAPPTVPLDTAAAPRPSPLLSPSLPPAPRPAVRTVPVMTGEANDAPLEAGVASASEPEATSATGELPGMPISSPVSSAAAERAADKGDGEDEGDGGRTAPTTTTQDAAWKPPNRVVVLPAAEGQTPAAQVAPEQNTSSVWPEDDEPSSPQEQGLWSRIGQALARSTTRPLRERSDGGDAEVPDQRAP